MERWKRNAMGTEVMMKRAIGTKGRKARAKRKK